MALSFQLLEEHALKNESLILSEQDKILLVEKMYEEHPWDDEEEQEFKNTLENPLLKSFLNKLTPGTYRPWVEDVIDQANMSVDVLLEEDLEIIKELVWKRRKLKIFSHTVPIRGSRKLKRRLDWSNYPRIPFPVLPRKYYVYDQEKGIMLKEND